MTSHGHKGMTPKEYREAKRKRQVAISSKRKKSGRKHNHRGEKIST